MIAGNGEKKTLRLVAEYADMCNVVGSPQVVGRLMEALDRHCADVGRDPATICRTVTSMVFYGRAPQKPRRHCLPSSGTTLRLSSPSPGRPTRWWPCCGTCSPPV
jgi:alkanesulfonate monooxygenase SsuD/methylene tetrahydromethanopterin reductase-like flavin-dependent oxidoreductase (luciferase family)